jgi:P-type Cu+ transporter
MTVAELAIGGMTCASCAARIERKLNRLDGVSAAVNFATETARVTFPATVRAEDLVSAVERAGYTALLAPGGQPPGDPRAWGGYPPPQTPLGWRLPASIALAVPVVVLGMVPAWQFPDWQWACLALASPVAAWGAWPFHRGALAGARHGAATMDTLISVGVAAAYLWSLVALTSGRDGETYLEVAAGVTALVLLGRRLEARARRRSGAALRALLSLGAKDVAVLRGLPPGPWPRRSASAR